MGHYSSDSTVGSIIIIMYKLLVAAAVITVASCEAEADPGYGYYYGAYPALYNAYPNWPGVSTPFSQSTCFGCRGKRSAEPGYYLPGFYHGFYPGVAGHPTGTSYVARSPQGLGKRSADADAEADAGYYYGAGYGYGYARAYGYGYP